jgi:hypothetical protein
MVDDDNHLLWPQNVLDTIEYRQETAYRRAADLLGLSGGPDEAFAVLCEKPTVELSPEQFRAIIGWEDQLVGKDWDNTKISIEKANARDPRPPSTRWEDTRVRQRWIGLQQDLAEKFKAIGVPYEMSPYVATLPSGDINARVSQSFGSDDLIIFLDNGLLRYLLDFACLVAWAVPPIPVDVLLSDDALRKVKGPYTMPTEASNQFTATLSTYIFKGTPNLNEEIRSVPHYNVGLFYWLIVKMASFVLMHEQAHISLQHFSHRRFGHDVETEADVAAVAALSSLHHVMGSWAVPIWAADLVLVAFKLLDTGLGVAAHGWGPKLWINQNHPPPEDRRRRLRTNLKVPPDVAEVAQDALANLLGMNDALSQTMEDIQMPFISIARGWGDQPSPLWKERIDRSIRPKRASSTSQPPGGHSR